MLWIAVKRVVFPIRPCPRTTNFIFFQGSLLLFISSRNFLISSSLILPGGTLLLCNALAPHYWKENKGLCKKISSLCYLHSRRKYILRKFNTVKHVKVARAGASTTASLSPNSKSKWITTIISTYLLAPSPFLFEPFSLMTDLMLHTIETELSERCDCGKVCCKYFHLLYVHRFLCDKHLLWFRIC